MRRRWGPGWGYMGYPPQGESGERTGEEKAPWGSGPYWGMGPWGPWGFWPWGPGAMGPFFGPGPFFGTPWGGPLTREQERELLKDQAEFLKEQLEEINRRLRELEEE
ncbi:MAG: hypothetical protein DRG55_01375 [Deltaproteobacteria bacterium]|nr:MAG: hypothetical protein DRG55_01375 [Deltaproteobacteria bacterium]